MRRQWRTEEPVEVHGVTRVSCDLVTEQRQHLKDVTLQSILTIVELVGGPKPDSGIGFMVSGAKRVLSFIVHAQKCRE